MLSIDAIQKANSGHPGAPMGMADIAEVLWNDFLRHNPADPAWPDRDRFVLSNGHASMLLYSLLHLSGYDLDIEEIKNFRQLHSKTPGHPEYGVTPGVETTTGPLGQGLANAVGMALAERMLAERFNRDGFPLVDHFTYVFLGDGCMMEGISHEACSLAGTLGLGKLIALYDDNGISIDGPVSQWFSDVTSHRFEAYGWHVIAEVDGHDGEQVRQALEEARSIQDRPSLICCKTTIGFGAPSLAGSHKSHGAPLGQEEVAAVRTKMGWSADPFEIPDEISQAWDARQRGSELQQRWQQLFEAYAQAHPELAEEFSRCMRGDLPAEFEQRSEAILEEVAGRKLELASRKASKEGLECFGPLLPELFGGSADLSGSNKTVWVGSQPLSRCQWQGNYCYFGVREFGMAAIMNGAALHGGLIPYSGTFLVFSDYARNAIRMAALMSIRNIFVLTHDSIGVGEDGPTHQPIEHASSLRLIPNLDVWRPCDAVETAVAWQHALQTRNRPSALLLSRQSMPHQERDPETLAAVQRGGYVLRDSQQAPEALILATGSEVQLAVQAAEQLELHGRRVRVVSMPCLERFEAQPREYQDQVLPPEVQAKVVVEAGVTGLWHKYAGSHGRILGLDRFGESAPGNRLFEYFGFTRDAVVQAVEELLGQDG
jgi:transketolase